MTIEKELSLENQVCFALSVAARKVVEASRPVLEPLGITHPQYLVLLVLWEKTPVSLKVLSQRLTLEPGTLSPLVKRLEGLGLVRRKRDLFDERTLSIELTEKGQALKGKARDVPKQVKERLNLSEAQLIELHKQVNAFIVAVDEQTK